MKILQVIPYFVPAYSYGGPVKVCFDISEELTRRGYQITVITTDALDNKNRIKKLQETIESIKVIRFKNISNWLAKNHNGFLPIGFYFWARKNIQNFDFVHCHDFFTLQNIITAHFCKKHNIPFAIQPHGTLSPIRQNAKFKKLKKFFLNLFSNVLKNSKNIIALTKNERDEIIKINPNFANKIKIIPNGLKTEEFENIEKIDLHKKYNIPKKNKIIGYIGRLQYIKGIDISLEVLSCIKNEVNFTYLIIGPDEGQKEKLKKIIPNLGLENNVIFTGIINGEEKLQTIKSCDLFLFTSRNEGLPMTILEVATLGVPQVLSENCNVPEIEEFEAGYEFKLKEKEGMTQKILAILKNTDLQKKLSENSKEMINKYFSLKSTCNKLEKLIK